MIKGIGVKCVIVIVVVAVMVDLIGWLV